MSKLDTPGSTDFLSTYSPFDRIDSELLNGVAGDIEVKVAEPGFCLFENGDYDPDEIYLMSGSISLIASDGRENIVNADNSHIRFPIARLRPRKYTAKASSEIQYFVINAAVLEEIQSSLSVDNVILQEMQ
jgi:CRP-like cAMP-binding protein